jgi:hypothetical protein
MQDGGVQVMNVQSILNGVQADFIRCPDGPAILHAASRHPHAEAIRVVVSTVPFFAPGRPSEFATPNDQRLLQRASAFEIRQQTRDWLVAGSAQSRVVFDGTS